jgi:uncharacterized protein (TIGR02147 family)
MKEAKDLLAEVLSERSAANPRYSLRAFARDLDVSPQQLSNVMNGRRGLGPELAEHVIQRLGLSGEERDFFLDSLRAKFSKSQLQRRIARTKINSIRASASTKDLELDLFKIISNWHHLALVELIKITPARRHTVSWFAKRLGVPESEIRFSLERLERLGLVSRTGKSWRANQDVVIADKGISTESVRNFHRQVLEKAIAALSFQTSAERYGSSSTVPVRVKDLDRAKSMIQKFRIDFDEALSAPDDGDEVYGLSFQFFKLTNTVSGDNR